VHLPLFADAIVGPLLASSVDFEMVQRGLQTRMAALLKQRRARTLNPRGNDHISSTRQGTKLTRVRRIYDTLFPLLIVAVDPPGMRVDRSIAVQSPSNQGNPAALGEANRLC
jgi:hypothetical protein